MSVETIPYTTKPEADRAPVSDEEEASTGAPETEEPKWPEEEPTETDDSVEQETNPETEEKSEETETTRSKVVGAANERVADFMEEHGEKIEAAKKATKRFGKWALRHAKVTGRVGFGLTLLSLEGVAKGTGFLVAQAVTKGTQAKRSWAKRREERNLKREADARNKRFDEETEAEHMNEAFDSKARAKAFYDGRIAEVYDEAHEMNSQFDTDKAHEAEQQQEAEREKERRQARVKAEVARRQKAYRKNVRQNRWNKIENSIDNGLDKMANRVRNSRIGKIALRASKAARVGFQAAKSSWETAK